MKLYLFYSFLLADCQAFNVYPLMDKYLYDERVWRKEQSDGKTLLTDVFPITGDPMDNHYMYRPMVEPRLLRQNDQVDRYLNEDRLFLNKENHDVLRESDQVDPCTDEDRKLWVNPRSPNKHNQILMNENTGVDLILEDWEEPHLHAMP